MDDFEDLYYKSIEQRKELENKLAEYECLMKKYNVEDLEHLDIMLFVLSGETKYQLAQLKQQLAEKEKEIEEINKAFLENRGLWKGKYEQAEKDKIKFAIAELEKVKTQCQFGISFACDEQEQRLYDFIDQRIKELKGDQ